MDKHIERFVVAIAFSVAYCFLAIGLLTSLINFINGSVPQSLFIAIAALGIILCSMYSSMIAQIKFNTLAIVIGSSVGMIVAATTSKVQVVPVSVYLPLVIAALVTEAATLFLKNPKIIRGQEKLIFFIHSMEFVVGTAGVLYSLFAGGVWIRPIAVILGITIFLMWSPVVIGGCPLTIIENQITNFYKKDLGVRDQGFMMHVFSKWFGLRFAHEFYERTFGTIIVCLFFYYAVDYLF